MTHSVENSRAGIGKFAAIGFAAALAALSTLPASAAPLSLGAGVPEAARTAPSVPVENVRCRGCAVGVGIAAGVIAGAAIANAARNDRNRYYYDEGPGYYGGGPGYGRPVYSRGPGRCWVETNPHRGTGYWGRC
ncbi:hypothetical protein [Ancylobacter radicis]|uniref:Uncharacterized protein n=1 Tax=Ancylobacter radicis TaxID=2836179 RepID=A0ABS5R530_9HYPH|nr:hypothetical protein [Ancylobacter radicis]MBS9476602.1 hypothetical protein [Ancylobacter radicis]